MSVAEMSALYPNHDDFGLQNVPVAQSSSAHLMDFGFNPEDPASLRRHYEKFALFAMYSEELGRFEMYRAPFDSDYLVDFVGTKTLYAYDCADWRRYRR